MPGWLDRSGLKLAEYTAESLFDGHLRLFQPRHGYRYAADPILLSAHLSPAPGSHILDIGSGCGIIPVILGYRHPETTITGVEIQKDLADLALKNAEENNLKNILIINQDILTVCRKNIPRPIDTIVSNPPYRAKNTGRLNPNRQKALARHELTLTIDQLYAASSRLLGTGGRVVVIFPSDRLTDLFRAMERAGMAPEWMRFIHPSEEKNAHRAIVSAVKNIKSSCSVLPPLTLMSRHNAPTKAYKGIFNP